MGTQAQSVSRWMVVTKSPLTGAYARSVAGADFGAWLRFAGYDGSYWLLKSEPDDWSWAEQVAKGRDGAEWTGIRNFSAQKHLRAMKKGERATWRDALAPELRDEFEQRYSPGAPHIRRKSSGSIVSFALTPLDISASGIRTLLRRGHSARYLLPAEVLAYIESHHLYRAKAPT